MFNLFEELCIIPTQKKNTAKDMIINLEDEIQGGLVVIQGGNYIPPKIIAPPPPPAGGANNAQSGSKPTEVKIEAPSPALST